MVFSVSGAKRLLVSASMVALLTACAVTPEPFTAEQLSKQASEDRADMFRGGEPLTGPLTVSDAIARALKYNLDRRTKAMEEAMALGQLDVDRFDLLPKLTANAGYAGRSEANVTRSRDVVTLQQSTSNPTYSSDRDLVTADLGLSWNILDFGVSYFTAHQNADRALIASERKRKTVHNLISEVRFAFWRAAAYQVLKDDVDHAVADAHVALDIAKTVEQENLRSPAESLRYQKSLLETLRQLTAVQQELSTAQIELAALVNLPPGSDLTLSVPPEMMVPHWDLTLESMEELAFANNADLREQGYLSRIAVDDTKKAILKLLPGISLSASRNYDSNSFLIDNQWSQTSAKLSWNLLNLVSAPSVIRQAETNEDVVKSRRIALRMAVLAQVHVAERQFRNSVSQYSQSDALWLVDKRLAELSNAKTANNAQGMLERVAGQSSAIASQLRRFQTYARVEQAYAKMQATLGRDLMPDSVSANDLKSLSGVIAARLNEWGKDGGAVDAPAPAMASSPKSATDSDSAGESGTWANVTRWLADGLKKADAPTPAKAATPTPPSPDVSALPAPADPQIGAVDKVISQVQELSRDSGRNSQSKPVPPAEQAALSGW